MSICDKTCIGCIYCAVLSGGDLTCDFLLVTHNRRGCPAGKGCERRISGTKALTIDQQIYRGRVAKNRAKLAEAGELPPAEMKQYLAELEEKKAKKRAYDKERTAARLAAMTPEELEAYRERVKQYSRDYYRNLDPAKKAAKNARSAALKRQRRLEKKQQKSSPINCPNCGAPVQSGRCEYCGTRFGAKEGMAMYEELEKEMNAL